MVCGGSWEGEGGGTLHMKTGDEVFSREAVRLSTRGFLPRQRVSWFDLGFEWNGFLVLVYFHFFFLVGVVLLVLSQWV